ncbi:MAG: hypothetical protein ACKO6J_00815 [Crocinitomicaceae bacterium]
MKKVLFSAVAIAALTLVSCGKSAEDVTKEYCDCVKAAGTDATKITDCATKAAEAAKDIKDWKADDTACK